MRTDWEGEVEFEDNVYWVHADYVLDHDTYGHQKLVIIEEIKIFDELSNEMSELESNSELLELVTSVIETELEEAA